MGLPAYIALYFFPLKIQVGNVSAKHLVSMIKFTKKLTIIKSAKYHQNAIIKVIQKPPPTC